MSKKHSISRVLMCFLCLILCFVPLSAAEQTENKLLSSLTNGLILPGDDNNTKNYILVCAVLDNPYWQSAALGASRAAKETGASLTVLGASDVNDFPNGTKSALSDAIAKNPDGIIAYLGFSDTKPLLNEAKDKNIPVIAIDADDESGTRLAYVGTSMMIDLGTKASDTITGLLPAGTKIGLICSSFEAFDESPVIKAFKDSLADTGYTVVDEREAGNDPELSYKVAEQMLIDHPDIGAVFSIGGENTAGIGNFIHDTGADIILVGMDDTDNNLALLRTGAIHTLIVRSTESMGYMAVNVLNEYLEKGTLEKDTYNIDALTVNSQNINTYRRTVYTPNTEYKTVRVGYYSGDDKFQSGSSNNERKSGYAYEYLQTVSTYAGWNYEYYYGSRREAVKMLKDGTVDLVVGVNKSESANDAFYLSTLDIGIPDTEKYFGVNKDRPDIFNELESALFTINSERPAFTSDIYGQYYNTGILSSVLSDFEWEYLGNMPQISFGYAAHNLPLCDSDEFGAPTGLISDLMEYISSYTKTPIRPVAYEDPDEMYKALKDGQIDVAFPGYFDLWENEKEGLKETEPFVSDRVMLVYSGEYTDDLLKRVACNKTGIGQQYYMNTYYPDSQLVFYNDRDQVFNAIRMGKENCTVGYSGVLQRYLFENPENTSLHVAYLPETVKLGFCVSAENSYLVSILNKAVQSMGAASINSALLSYTGTEKSFNVHDVLKQYSTVIIAILAFFISTLIVSFAVYKRKSARHHKEQYEANMALQDALKQAKETETALEEAIEKANAASVAKTRFLSSMSHDIRTPMNAIVGMAAIASKYPDDKERVADCLNKIAISGEHLLTLINDILDISKVESGKLTLNPINFSLKESFSHLRDIAEGTAHEKHLSLIMKDNLPCDMITADKVRIDQVFINILSNAIKYTPGGGRVIATLDGTLKDDGTVDVVYTVEDTGIGMSQEFMKTMYNSFSRAQDTRINKIQGAGLGLTIVKEMTDLMGGTIICESREREGTTFKVYLNFPVVEVAEAVLDDTDHIVNLNDLHILVAEDNDLNWEVISELLDIYGITCERAENGQVCVDMLVKSEPNTYSLVLMDVQMPILNGKDATKKIRALERDDLKNMPIVALSADSFAEDILDCFKAGMNGHVSKPVDINKLAQEVGRVLKEGKGR